MRSEKQMFELILGVAKKDERIRAVYMNGSRTNPNVQKDIFQDYDIVYVVTETSSFINDEKWIDIFGELIMIQEPDKNDKLVGMDINFEKSYAYLMLFTDGNRIDLHIETKANMLEGYKKDKLTIPLLDKDSILPQINIPTDRDYWIKKPSEPEFASCCNDFWWCLQNVGKGIWRGELPYAKQMFEYVIRARLDEMVSWWIGSNHDFQVSVGKMGKYYPKFLPEELWSMYKETYSDCNIDNFWESIFVTCDMFRIISTDVARYLSCTYPINDDVNMSKYLRHIRNLAPDATEIF